MVKHADGLHQAGRRGSELRTVLTTSNALSATIASTPFSGDRGAPGRTAAAVAGDDACVEKSTRERALENYANILDETEEFGGILWAYKSFIFGSLQETEGIWLST